MRNKSRHRPNLQTIAEYSALAVPTVSRAIVDASDIEKNQK